MSSTPFTGDGTVGPFAFSWPYISRDHVQVLVDAAPVAFTFLNDFAIQLAAPAAIGAAGLIRRITPADDPLVDWSDGANINAESLDLQTLQLLFLIQESEATFAQLQLTDLNAAVVAAEAAAAAAEAAAGLALTGPSFYRVHLGGL